MKTIYRIFILPAAILALVFSCRKTPTDLTVHQNEVVVSKPPVQMDFNCTTPVDYGDSIIFPQTANGNKDYIVSPLNAGVLGAGKYLAWPQGLMLDSSTGEIDLTQSQTGLRYVVGFIKQGTSDTCLKNLIVGGITYVDSIYDLSAGDTLAIPYFDANAKIPSPCDTSNDTDYPGNSAGNNGNGGTNNGNAYGQGNNKCSFDGTGNNGKSGQANAKNVKVRTLNGTINLKMTVDMGAFGAVPVNGASVTVPVYYKINDKSRNALQVINVNVTYYDTRGDVPSTLVNTIELNRNSFFNNTPILSANPRPPLIVIVRRGF